MANPHAYRFFILATLLVLPSFLHASKFPSSRKLSFELHLDWPPSNLHNSTAILQQPLTPFLLSHQPLLQFDDCPRTRAGVVVGSVHGLFLADPAASMELRHVFFTAALQKTRGQIMKGIAGAANDKEEGSLVMMGSFESGAIAVVGGTGSFAFASGVAKVSMAPPAAGQNDQRVIVMEVELQSEGDDPINVI